jgi:hypothetical protein
MGPDTWKRRPAEGGAPSLKEDRPEDSTHPALLFVVRDPPGCHAVFTIHCPHADSASDVVATDGPIHPEDRVIAFLQDVHRTTCCCGDWLVREAAA